MARISAGGTVSLTCGSLSGSGIISANGGAGNGAAGGGGGGRIAITYTSSNSFTGTITAFGGTGGVAGGAGTIYTKRNTAVAGILTVNNGGLIGTNTLFTSAVLSSALSSANLAISGGATVMFYNSGSSLFLSNITVGANSALTKRASGHCTKPDVTPSCARIPTA